MHRVIRKQIVIIIGLLLVLFCAGCSHNTSHSTDPTDNSTSAPKLISIEDAQDLISVQLPQKSYEFHIQFQREEKINSRNYYYFQVYTLGQEPLESDAGSYYQQFTYAWIYVDAQTGELYADNPDGSLAPWKASLEKEKYSAQDFDFVITGQTSTQDVHYALPNHYAVKATVDGGILEYALEDGQYMQLVFDKDSLTVSAMNIVAESILNSEEMQKKYYTMEDFQSLVIGTSTDWDVLVIAPGNTEAIAAGFGAIMEYPTEDGGKILVKLQGPDMIVFDIEYIAPTAVDSETS